MPEPLKLYDYRASGNCYKVRLAAAQLGIPLERVPIDIFAGRTLGADYAAINPARTTPVLELPSGAHLAESNAILLYLGEGSPLVPAMDEERARTYQWLFFERSTFAPAVAATRFLHLTGRLRLGTPESDARLAEGREALELLAQRLRATPFVAGEHYTLADIALYAYGHVAHEAGYDMDAYSSIRRWLDRVATQPKHMNDLEPYPANARPGHGRSIYD